MKKLIIDLFSIVNKAWASGETDHFVAVAQYDFEGMADRELKVQAGQKIRLAPAASQPPNVKGWVLASDGVKIGLVPTNYIKILGKRAGNPNPAPLNNNDELKLSPRSFPLPPTSSAYSSSNPHPFQNQHQQSSFTEENGTSEFFNSNNVTSDEHNPNIVVTPPIQTNIEAPHPEQDSS